MGNLLFDYTQYCGMYDIQLFSGDCIELMELFKEDEHHYNYDLILADLPYGISGCKWDTPLDLDKMWRLFNAVTKPNANIILFASQPFTSALVMSNPDKFRYEIIWEKDKPSNFAFAKNGVMRYHESILVFYDGKPIYNPQMTIGKPNHSVGKGVRKKANESGANTAMVTNKVDGIKHPKSVIKFNREAKPIHPTQKPIELLKWLIETYSNKGDKILDCCMGVGSTALAALESERGCTGIELEKEYYDKAVERINPLIIEKRDAEYGYAVKT